MVAAARKLKHKILIGTASWTDPGFIADWYPPKLAARDRLRWYAEHFDMVEVNATFYAVPLAKAVENWCRETPSDFVFDIKLPKLLSFHAMSVQFLPPAVRRRVRVDAKGKVERSSQAVKLVAKQFLEAMRPLAACKKLGAFLLQLSPAFSPRTHTLDELNDVCGLFEGFTVAVELRNRDWVDGKMLEETLDFFRQRKIPLVTVDAPDSDHFTVMPIVDILTSPRIAYMRLHGRNNEGYVKGRTVAERFDYDYSEKEVKQIAERIRNLEAEAAQIHVVANNNRSNYAPKLALRLREVLGLKEKLVARLAEQQRLL